MQKWMFLLFVHGEFIFHLILMGLFVMYSIGKFLSEKGIFIYYYFFFYIKLGAKFSPERVPKRSKCQIFNVLIFHSFFNFFWQNDHLNVLLVGFL